LQSVYSASQKKPHRHIENPYVSMWLN
jgi:hypothetical protein